MNGRHEELWTLIRERSKTQHGFDTSQISDWCSPSRSSNICAKMVKMGELYRAKVRHKEVHYFDTQERADAYVLARRMPVRHIVVGKTRVRAPWTPDAEPHFPVNADGSPAYKITIAPKPPPPRFTGTFNQVG